MKTLAIKEPQEPKCRPAQTRGVVEHLVENRLELTGRGIDDLQYLSGRGLLLQVLARLGQEPCILHCDDRLRGEVSVAARFACW
jgi:hypothetical protein